MAYTLLDGTNANIDIMTAVPATPTVADKSLKCLAGSVSFTFRKSTTRKTTFCSSGWVSSTPGDKQMFAVVGAFMSKGDVLADPLVLFNTQLDLNFILTSDTGCTIQGKWIETEDAGTLVAAQNSGRSLAFESQGAVTTTWVVV